MLCSDCGGYDRCGHCLTEVGPIGPWRERVSRLAKLLGEARTVADKVTQLDHEYTASHAKVYGISDPPDPDYPAMYLQEAAALICARIDAALSAVSGLAEKEVGDGNG